MKSLEVALHVGQLCLPLDSHADNSTADCFCPTSSRVVPQSLKRTPGWTKLLLCVCVICDLLIVGPDAAGAVGTAALRIRAFLDDIVSIQ